MNSVILRLAISTLLSPLTSLAKAGIKTAIRSWYKECLKTESTVDDAIAGAVAKIFSIDVSDIDVEEENGDSDGKTEDSGEEDEEDN